MFEFDTLGRLVTAKGGGATGVSGVTANWTQSYAYDRYGNRTGVTASGITQNSQTVPTDGLATQSYDQPSNRINTSGYIYDLAGNLVRGQDQAGNWQRYEYDAADRLIHVKDDAGNDKLNNGYTSSRQRLVSWQPGVTDLTWFVWGGSSVIAEYKSTTWGNDPLVWQKCYIYAGSRLLSTYTNNGAGGETVEYHHPDRLGTKLVTNDAANTSFEQATLPFGTSLDAEAIGTNTTNQKFTSYDRSTVTGIDYAVNRSYSAAQGRFTSVDPIGMSATNQLNPQSMNLYAYVENNPIDFVDPSGLDFYVGPPPRLPREEPDWAGFLRFLLESMENMRQPHDGGDPGGPGGGGGGIEPGGEPHEPSQPQEDNPCRRMANVAQDVYNRVSKEFADKSNWRKLYEFNQRFSKYYVGMTLNILSAPYLAERGPDRRTVEKDPNRDKMLGEVGFKKEFRQGLDSNDQTHHFVTYLSGGINDMGLTTLIHILRDDNQPDKDLGEAGFRMGEELAHNPEKLSDIRNMILSRICGE